jgi:hypothetical protein
MERLKNRYAERIWVVVCLEVGDWVDMQPRLGAQGYVKVGVERAPIIAKVRGIDAAHSRMASAIVVQPCHRHRSLKSLRMLASTRGGSPVCI